METRLASLTETSDALAGWLAEAEAAQTAAEADLAAAETAAAERWAEIEAGLGAAETRLAAITSSTEALDTRLATATESIAAIEAAAPADGETETVVAEPEPAVEVATIDAVPNPGTYRGTGASLVLGPSGDFRLSRTGAVFALVTGRYVASAGELTFTEAAGSIGDRPGPVTCDVIPTDGEGFVLTDSENGSCQGLAGIAFAP